MGVVEEGHQNGADWTPHRRRRQDSEWGRALLSVRCNHKTGYAPQESRGGGSAALTQGPLEQQPATAAVQLPTVSRRGPQRVLATVSRALGNPSAPIASQARMRCVGTLTPVRVRSSGAARGALTAILSSAEAATLSRGAETTVGRRTSARGLMLLSAMITCSLRWTTVCQ